jgi:hypothetical protein
MNKTYWIVIYTSTDKKNLVCGPFGTIVEAIGLHFEHLFDCTATSIHDSLESALNDDSKFVIKD